MTKIFIVHLKMEIPRILVITCYWAKPHSLFGSIFQSFICLDKTKTSKQNGMSWIEFYAEQQIQINHLSTNSAPDQPPVHKQGVGRYLLRFQSRSVWLSCASVAADLSTHRVFHPFYCALALLLYCNNLENMINNNKKYFNIKMLLILK